MPLLHPLSSIAKSPWPQNHNHARFRLEVSIECVAEHIRRDSRCFRERSATELPLGWPVPVRSSGTATPALLSASQMEQRLRHKDVAPRWSTQ